MAENDLPSLPPLLADSYRHYKDLTRSFATWLAGTGERCGFRLSTAKQTTTRPPELSSEKANPRLKGRARKLARDADKKAQNKSSLTKTLLLKDFIPLAKYIASSKPPPHVPSSVVTKLERAIDLRRRCASWFNTEVQSTASLASNASHEHFINSLNTVLDILKPLCNQSTGSGYGKNNTTNGKEGKEGKESVEPQRTLHNQFEALTVETLEDDQEELENFSQQRTNPAKPGKTPSPATTIYTPEQQLPDDEFILGCFCFFQDLQDVRGFLKETWQKYKDKQVTLITASLITTAALDFVRKSELNFKTTFSQSGDYYDTFVDQMFRRACTRQGHPCVARRNFHATTTNLHETQPYVDDMVCEADWIMLPSWHLLNYSARIFLLDENGVPCQFQAVLAQEDHMVKVWQFLAPDPVHADRLEHQSFDALLLSIGMGTFKNQFDNIGVDQFRTGLVEMLQTKVVPAWLVFATQNFLDIQHILKQDVFQRLAGLQIDICNAS
ncbi:hypothetical protein GJ744_007305 [Endocarpon pusillum]|uniref:DUF6604 domain-containing protein n=1 Tax=Endocarpon pusillum TaxID=364733 RepID=A0A8H7AN29_9EURO|nr:hypothetical protein GJ744_007305 [Endocarpon pusillum]